MNDVQQMPWAFRWAPESNRGANVGATAYLLSTARKYGLLDRILTPEQKRDGDGIALEKGVHTLRMANLNGEGVNLGWLALIPVEELPLALDPARPDRLATDYLKAMEAEFKLRNLDLKK